jgi:demethylmenaquinone methyltransferase / 2-methoxy-6-polyprenyl-1,4-benzoquinol methylase
MPSGKAELAVAGLYDGIFRFYGAANSLLTFGLDRFWRRRAALLAKAAAPNSGRALDACCGTGDFSLELLKAYGPGLNLHGADLSAPMLGLARLRLPGADLRQAEAKKLPWPDDNFDLVTISFATRNLYLDRAALLAALREFRRVLRPGGLFLNLETTRPHNPALRLLMNGYVSAVIGLLNLASPESRRSYAFLRNTIIRFFTADKFSELLLEAGFASARHETLFPGAVAVHLARK